MLQEGFGLHVKVAVQGWLAHPLASVTLAVSVQVPGSVQDTGTTTVGPWSVRVAFTHPLRATVNGAAPLAIVMVKFCKCPTHWEAVGGLMLQDGFGFTTNCAGQLLLQPNASVTVAV